MDQFTSTFSVVNKKSPKLINEKAAIQIANKFLFSFWSTICPANNAIVKAGIISIKPIIPIDKGSFVIEYTCHSITINCIDQPKTNKNRTKRNMLNSLILNDAYGSFFSILFY